MGRSSVLPWEAHLASFLLVLPPAPAANQLHMHLPHRFFTWFCFSAGSPEFSLQGKANVQPLECARLPISTSSATTPSQSVRGSCGGRREVRVRCSSCDWFEEVTCDNCDWNLKRLLWDRGRANEDGEHPYSGTQPGSYCVRWVKLVTLQLILQIILWI